MLEFRANNVLWNLLAQRYQHNRIIDINIKYKESDNIKKITKRIYGEKKNKEE